MLVSKDDSLHWFYDGEHVQIEPWGPDAFRVRSTLLHTMPQDVWALSEPVAQCKVDISLPEEQPTLEPPGISLHGSHKNYGDAYITNGQVEAKLSAYGKLTIVNHYTGRQVLEEYNRTKVDHRDPKMSATEVKARDFHPHGTGGTETRLTYRMEPQSPDEKIYGMGQYQHPYLNLRGLELELAQRNSQASVPFFLSSLQYGFLWNNPAVGRATFGMNTTSFEAASTIALDFWIVVGKSPRDILRRYADVTGHAPMMPEYGLGFWQSKLRYKNQAELMAVAREYKKRGLPIDVIVADYFHWPLQGDWHWDSTAWPDPKAMVRELEDMDIKLLASVWPTVDKRSKSYAEMMEKGYLIRGDRGLRTLKDFMGQTIQVDFTKPDARKYVWDRIRQNYHDIGVKCFWLDEAEPNFNTFQFENYRYSLGPHMSVGNIYPVRFSQAFYEGQIEAGQPVIGKDGIVNLVRCAWAGSQKYSALVWSGDIASSWPALRNQFCAGLNMGLAGIPWWTTDIGGFYGGDGSNENFRELLIRWFQWGSLCPVMRIHGCRIPVSTPPPSEGGVAECPTGAPNEVWSYGEEAYRILTKFLRFRERLRGYVRGLMQEASDDGSPIIRTMFYEFPDDEKCWETEKQYMFGDKYLCAPIFEYGQREQTVYLPKSSRWAQLVIGDEDDTADGVFEGGQTVSVSCPLDMFPVFYRLT